MIIEFILCFMILILFIKSHLTYRSIKNQKIDLSNLRKEQIDIILSHDSINKRIDNIEKLLTKDINDIKTDISLICDLIEKEKNIKFHDEEI